MPEPHNQQPVSWAPRVPQRLIRRLYEDDARGIVADAAVDEVAYGLYARCESFLRAGDAYRGQVWCPGCGTPFAAQGRNKGDTIRCPGCGWRTTWGAYFATIRHKQLSGAETIREYFRSYVERLPNARTPRGKVLLVDWLIHQFHTEISKEPSRPVAVNLISGSMGSVMRLLDELTYGDGSTPGTARTRDEWHHRVDTGPDWLREGLQDR